MTPELEVLIETLKQRSTFLSVDRMCDDANAIKLIDANRLLSGIDFYASRNGTRNYRVKLRLTTHRGIPTMVRENVNECVGKLIERLSMFEQTKVDTEYKILLEACLTQDKWGLGEVLVFPKGTKGLSCIQENFAPLCIIPNMWVILSLVSRIRLRHLGIHLNDSDVAGRRPLYCLSNENT